MPWNETCAMGERMKFIVECERQEYSMAAVCRSFGISRKTGKLGDRHLFLRPTAKQISRLRPGRRSAAEDLSLAPD